MTGIDLASYKIRTEDSDPVAIGKPYKNQCKEKTNT